MKYKFIDKLTSDVLFEVYGKDLKELFENTAEALFSIICDINTINEELSYSLELKANDLEELMINWLQELIALVDIEEMFFSKFNIIEVTEKHIKAEIFGEKITPKKGRTLVKAVTYHKFKIEKNKKGYTATISLDI